ncbi:MAG TPA: hypothetical protein VNN80_01035 [Polyangiaceae bacterium]|nr:hypothetical protein [Polyangiaceae bacterium]
MDERAHEPRLPAVGAHLQDRVAFEVSAVIFGSFLGYYGLLCFRHDGWGGDFQMYCAGIAQLYRNFAHPLHEAMDVPGAQSTMYTLYLVVLAALGKLFGATPYRMLEVAGLANLALYAAGAAYFFSKHSLQRRWWLPASCFIYATLFLRWRHFGWSSETSLTNLQYIQSFPSTMGWALAFFAFGLMEAFQRRRAARTLITLTLVLAIALLTHVLTASWMIGILGLHTLWVGARDRDLWALPGPALALGAALGLAALWPYSPFFGQSSMQKIPENAPFGASWFDDFPSLYGLAAPCFLYVVARLRRHAFWLFGMLATLAALVLSRRIGFTFGNRYSFYAAFFAQCIVAEVMALGVLALLGPFTERVGARALLVFDRAFSIAVLCLALVIWLPSPMRAQAVQEVDFGRLWSPLELLRMESPLDAYYREVEELRPVLGPADRVVTPVTRAVFDIAAVTGAQVISSPNAWLVPDRVARQRDMNLFFSGKANTEARATILRRRRATRVLLPRSHFGYMDGLLRQFGEPLYRSSRYVVWATES